MHVYCEGDDELRPYSHVKEVSVETVADPEERPKLRTRLLAPARAAANRLATDRQFLPLPRMPCANRAAWGALGSPTHS